MKILFMGTPEFAVESLKRLEEKYEIVGIVTKVDKPNSSRGKKIIYNPVKQYGINNDIKVYQPENIRNEETYNLIKEMNPDLIVVVAYGKIIPNNIIEYPKFGIINVHSSILPKFRGAAPINAAIVEGEKETGVTIMDIAEELDAGAIIKVAKTTIEEDDNFLTLHDRLKFLGAECLLEAVEEIFEKKAVRKEQEHDKATFVKPFKKEDLKIKWEKTSFEINNFVRGMTPFPSVYTKLGDKIIKVLEVEKIENKSFEGKVGEVIDKIKNKGFVIKTGDGAIILKRIKPENKGVITGSDSINGKLLEIGNIFS